MPLVLAGILRAVLMAITTAIPLTIAQEFLDGTMKKLVEEIQSETGLSLEESKDILVNILFDLALNSIIIGTVIKTKFAVKTAEYLGFTSKGFKTRVLTTKAKEAIKVSVGPWEKFKAFSLISKIISVVIAAQATVWLGNIFIQAIEPGIYKPTQTNNVWEKFLGIRPFPETDILASPPPFSPGEFLDFAAGIEAAGIVGINNPFKNATVIYSRKELAELLLGAYGNAVLRGLPLTPAKFTPTLAQYFISRGRVAKDEPKQTAEVSRAFTAPKIRVFTGIVSQGVIGAPIAFTPRQDDLIENIQELQDAAHNNEAPFLASLPGRVIREIKIVSSITTKDGFTQRGTATQVISGYNKSGTPKYRTVVNKFAVADMFLLSEKGNRTKISRIVYGPVDSIRFQPVQGDILALEATLKTSGVTSDPADLTQVISGGQLTMLPAISDLALPLSAPVAPLAVPIAVTPRDYFVNYDAFFDQVFYISGSSIVASPNFATLLTPEEKKPLQNYGEQISEGIKKIEARGVPVNSYRHKIFAGEIDGRAAPQINTNSFEEFFGSGAETVAPATGGALPAAALNAGTLYDFYTAQGQPLPSVAQRAPLYESLGLGQKAYYTGTAEQNLKLLTKLQGK